MLTKFSKNDVVKIILPECEIPKQWYNIIADMPNRPEAYLSPRTLKPAQKDELSAIFCDEIIAQEMATDRYVDIPEEVREKYKQWRPTPLYRARNLEKALGTTARIYYKYEGTNATGSHKLNSALAQAYYNKKAGVKKLTTETGAGQWGSALSLSCKQFDLDLEIYMVKVSFEQKPYRKSFMQTFGAKVIPSPSMNTQCGRNVLANDPNCTGSLGIAISEACEVAAMDPDAKYSLGSVLNHVCMHQTVIGLEAKKQLEYIDEYPDIVIACCGGGSNFAGMANPFLQDKLTKGTKLRAIAVEPAACPTLTRGEFTFDYGDSVKIGPIAKMYTLGHDFMPSGIHAGGLRYHGASPIVSQLYHDGIIEAQAYGQKSCFEAAIMFANNEGIIPAPESSHAIRAAINEAIAARDKGEEKVILFNLSGHGYFDMYAYDSYLSGNMVDSDITDELIEQNLKKVPKIQD